MSGSLSKGKKSAKTTFAVRNTGFSRLSGTTLSLDPQIRALRDQSLSSLTGGVGDFQSRLAQLRSGLEGNQGLEAARVNPILRAGALQQGTIRQDLGRRGLGGSSFLQNALGRSAQDFSVREGDARSLARDDLMRSLFGLDQAGLQATGQQASLENQIAQQLLQQEMAAFEFGKGQKSKGKSFAISGGITPNSASAPSI